MLRIEPATKTIWKDFSLRIDSVIDFRPGVSYHLKGSNGSGKSSFITQILLPLLISRVDIYTLYFEQQMHFQIQATKAYASIIKPHWEIKNEKDTVEYLLENLKQSLELQDRPCFILMDESYFELQICDYLPKHIPSYCLIFASHSDLVPASQNIIFEPLSATSSKVYASAD